ncbi:MAG: exopolysaccharide biosynthesis protein [Caulobacteraceae bacterium]
MTSTAITLQPEAETEAISDVLQRVLEQGAEKISVGELVDVFGSRAFGALLFIFSVPNLLPLPPGSSTILGAPLVLISPQLALGVRRPWIPRWLAKRSISREAMRKSFAKLMPRLKQLERHSRPRLGVMFGPVQDRLLGLVCFALALVLILPIPFGNLLPAASVSALGFSLTQRDGAVALLGYLLTAASVAVLVLSAGAVLAAVEKLVHILGM